MTGYGSSAAIRIRRPRRGQALLSGRKPVGFWGHGVMVLLLLFAVGPILIFVLASLKTRAELATNPFGLPAEWQWSNFAQAWTDANMGLGLLNSAILVWGTVLGVVVVASLAAYAMARLRLPGGSGVVLYLLVVGSLPTQMFLVPLFYLETRSGLYDTLFGVIVIYCATLSPFATLLLRSFLLALPRELEEAARIDGANEIQIAVRVVLPNAIPGILTIALVTGLAAYNEFLFAVTFLQSQDKLPVSTAFFAFQTGYSQNAALIAAAGVIMLLPMLLLFIALQRRFVDGLSATGMSS